MLKPTLKKIGFLGTGHESLRVLRANHRLKWELVYVALAPEFGRLTRNPLSWLNGTLYRVGCRFPKTFPLAAPFLKSQIKFLSKRSSERRRAQFLLALTGIRQHPAESVDEYLRLPDCDLCVIDSWSILPEEYLQKPTYGCLCLHPSSLPLYRGALPTLATLTAGEKSSALSIFKPVSKQDEGPIFKQIPFAISANEDWFSIEEKIAGVVAANLAASILDAFEEKHPWKQQEGATTTTPKWNAYRQILPNIERRKDVLNKCNFYPWFEPALYCWVQVAKKKIWIRRCHAIPMQMSSALKATRKGLVIRLSDGCVLAPLFTGISLRDWIYSLRQSI